MFLLEMMGWAFVFVCFCAGVCLLREAFRDL